MMIIFGIRIRIAHNYSLQLDYDESDDILIVPVIQTIQR